jgi:hypothetical protein
MPKLYLTIIFFISVLGVNAQSTLHSGNINDVQLRFIKENYNWHTEGVIIINFLQPKSNCHYDAYTNLKVADPWWTEFYSKLNLDGVANRFVYSDRNAARKIIDDTIYLADTDKFLLNTFFSKKKFCHGVIVINRKGEFQQKSSEYSGEEIRKFLEILNK